MAFEETHLQLPGRPRAVWRNQTNTRRIVRGLLEGVAAGNVAGVVSFVTRARRRGASYATIARWFGPRASCPPHLHSLLDRVLLFASIEGT